MNLQKSGVWPLITILAIVGAVISTSYAQTVLYSKNVNGTITIVLPNSSNSTNTNSATYYELGVYADPDCTKELTAIDLGELNPGVEAAYPIYVKNLGNTNVTVRIDFNVYDPDTGINPFYNTGYVCEDGILEPGEVECFVLLFEISENVEAGQYTFTVYVKIVGS